MNWKEVCEQRAAIESKIRELNKESYALKEAYLKENKPFDAKVGTPISVKFLTEEGKEKTLYGRFRYWEINPNGEVFPVFFKGEWFLSSKMKMIQVKIQNKGLYRVGDLVKKQFNPNNELALLIKKVEDGQYHLYNRYGTTFVKTIPATSSDYLYVGHS